MRWFSGRAFGRLRYVARSTIFPEDLVTTKREFVLVYAVRLFFLVGQRLWKDKCQQQAAALAFQTLLSLVPLLAVAMAVASGLDMSWFESRLVAFLEYNLLPDAADDVALRLKEIVDNVKPGTLGLVGGSTLVVLSIMLLFNVEKTVNEIFRAPSGRAFLVRVAFSVLLLVAAPLTLGLSLYFTGKVLGLTVVVDALRALGLTIAALFLCYWLLPHRKVSLRHALVSAAVAGVLFEIVKVLFALYAAYVGGTLSSVYGAFAILPLFLIWLYTAWLIFLFGAELNAALHEVRHHHGLSGHRGE
ncbi:MAG: YhjD/YihY/BrkB family envelope integrity protein [Deltaproteobacteria bacterium]|nr:YhjD/YihY/BrkB family envelope integrity protein [Deltaproteobacteria bacterium]